MTLALSSAGDTEVAIAEVRRTLTAQAYAAGDVTVIMRVYDPSDVTPLAAAVAAPFDLAAQAFVALIPAVSATYASVILRVTVTASGRSRVQSYPCPVLA